ncbi:MAG TPA: type II secretion system protein [Candidatus Fimivivens sp.]|nr:type II secretion system protein [Candidatus Fimivivens sp.]
MKKRGSARASGTRSGFTLVEMVITTAIIGIVSAISMVSLSAFRVKRDVESSARTFAAAIREAQDFALTGKNISATAGNVPCEFRARTSGGVYYVEQADAASGGACASYPAGGSGTRFLNGVTASATEVRFRIPRAEPLNVSGSELSSGSIDFVLTKGGVTGHVCVYPLGRVDERPIGSGC